MEYPACAGDQRRLGYLGVATGTGATVRQASAEAYRVASQDWERVAALRQLDRGPPRG